MAEIAHQLPLGVRVKLLCERSEALCERADTERWHCDELLANLWTSRGEPVMPSPSVPYNLHVPKLRRGEFDLI